MKNINKILLFFLFLFVGFLFYTGKVYADWCTEPRYAALGARCVSMAGSTEFRCPDGFSTYPDPNVVCPVDGVEICCVPNTRMCLNNSSNSCHNTSCPAGYVPSQPGNLLCPINGQVCCTPQQAPNPEQCPTGNGVCLPNCNVTGYTNDPQRRSCTINNTECCIRTNTGSCPAPPNGFCFSGTCSGGTVPDPQNRLCSTPGNVCCLPASASTQCPASPEGYCFSGACAGGTVPDPQGRQCSTSGQTCCVPDPSDACPAPPDGFCYDGLCPGGLMLDSRSCPNASQNCCVEEEIVIPPTECTPNATVCDIQIVNGVVVSAWCPCGESGCGTNARCVKGVGDTFFCQNDTIACIAEDDPLDPDDSTYESEYTGPIITVNELISLIYDIMLPISIGVGLLFIIKAGYVLKTSEGNPTKKQQGIDDLTGAVVGTLFVGLSLVILRIIINSILGGNIT